MSECNKPYTIMHASELDVDNLASVPDYFLGIRIVEDESTGNAIYTPVRIPGERVMPTGPMANVVAITTNNTSLMVPENQVRAGYIDAQPGGNVMRYSDNNNAPMFLMLGEYTNGRMLIQTTGFLTIPAGHQYIVGAQYYDDGTGTPTTDSATGRKLFRPVDAYMLVVNGEF